MFKKIFVFIFLIISIALVHLSVFVQSASIGYKSNKVRNELNELRSKNRTLAAYVAKEESLYNIDRI